MKKLLLIMALVTVFCGTAGAETVTFDFTASNPYGWDNLAKDESGYIDDSAKPVKCTQAPVTLEIAGRCRRLAQKAFGGLECLLIYNGSSITFSCADGYKMTEIAFYSGKDKINGLKVQDGADELGAQESEGDGWNHNESGAHLDGIVRTAYCNTAGPVVIGNENGGTQVITEIAVTCEVRTLKEAGLQWSAREFTAYMGHANEFPTLTKATDAVIDYQSEDESVATIDAEGHITLVAPGVTRIIAGCDATQVYDWGEAVYYLTVMRQGEVMVTFDFTKFSAVEGSDTQYITGFPDLLVGTWWTTNPDESYASGTQFKPLTITQDGAEIKFDYDNGGGHGNVRGTTTSKQNNLQLGGSACMYIKGTETGSSLYGVTLQGNRKRTASGLSLLDKMTTDDNGTLAMDNDTQVLTWTPKSADAVCWLDAPDGAYIETITVSYKKYDGITDAVQSGDDTDAPVEYYNLQGMRVQQPDHGFYIRRQGTKVSKIIIR